MRDRLHSLGWIGFLHLLDDLADFDQEISNGISRLHLEKIGAFIHVVCHHSRFPAEFAQPRRPQASQSSLRKPSTIKQMFSGFSQDCPGISVRFRLSWLQFLDATLVNLHTLFREFQPKAVIAVWLIEGIPNVEGKIMRRFGGSNSIANAISDRSRVVGVSDISKMTDLNTSGSTGRSLLLF